MISVIWNKNKIVSVVALPPCQSFNKKFFTEEVLKKLDQYLTLKDIRKNDSKILLHIDNAPPHSANVEMTKLKIQRMRHPPYSPDIAPSDFFLFGYLKMQLEGMVFQNQNELISSVESVLFKIPKVMLENSLRNWEKRLVKCIETNGEYVI